MTGGVAGEELAMEVLPFVGHLTSSDRDFPAGVRNRDFGRVEVIAARLGFGVQTAEEFREGSNGVGVGFEAGELGVVAVAAGRALQDLLGEQGFAPGGDEALGVEIAGVKCPEAHEGSYPTV